MKKSVFPPKLFSALFDETCESSNLSLLCSFDIGLIVEVEKQNEDCATVEDERVVHPANKVASKVQRLSRMTHADNKLRLKRFKTKE